MTEDALLSAGWIRGGDAWSDPISGRWETLEGAARTQEEREEYYRRRIGEAAPGSDARLRTVVRAVSWATRVAPSEIMGRSRTARVMAARQVAYIVLRDEGWSARRIGQSFRHVDHTSVLLGCDPEHRERHAPFVDAAKRRLGLKSRAEADAERQRKQRVDEAKISAAAGERAEDVDDDFARRRAAARAEERLAAAFDRG